MVCCVGGWFLGCWFGFMGEGEGEGFEKPHLILLPAASCSLYYDDGF